VKGDSYSEIGFGTYKNFDNWDIYIKITGKSLNTLNLEANINSYLSKKWKLGFNAYLWDSRSLLGERNTLDFSKTKTQQVSVDLSYVY